MPIKHDTARLMTLYPRIYFACHQRHIADPATARRISAHQASILDHLDELETTSLAGLARHMGVTPSTMSLAIDRLERGGYVVRRRDLADRRRVHLTLTKQGVRIREARSVLDPSLVRSMLQQLSPTTVDWLPDLKAAT